MDMLRLVEPLIPPFGNQTSSVDQGSKPPPPLPGNIVGHWKFDEGSGTTASDSAGTNIGTLLGDPTWVAGKINQTLDFDGVGDYVDVGQDSSIKVTSNLTLSAWINTSADPVGRYQGIIARGTYVAFMLHPTEDVLRVYATPSGGSGKEALRCSTGASLNDGLWHHVAVTYDGATWRAYVDGIEDCTGTGVTGTLKNSAITTRIGHYTGGNTAYFKGPIDNSNNTSGGG